MKKSVQKRMEKVYKNA